VLRNIAKTLNDPILNRCVIKAMHMRNRGTIDVIEVSLGINILIRYAILHLARSRTHRQTRNCKESGTFDLLCSILYVFCEVMDKTLSFIVYKSRDVPNVINSLVIQWQEVPLQNFALTTQNRSSSELPLATLSCIPPQILSGGTPSHNIAAATEDLPIISTINIGTSLGEMYAVPNFQVIHIVLRYTPNDANSVSPLSDHALKEDPTPLQDDHIPCSFRIYCGFLCVNLNLSTSAHRLA
jgi:hypothetical protein